VTVSGADSERVRAHPKERQSPAKPDRRVNSDGAADNTRRRSRRMTATSAVRPDERGTQVGRERPPRGRARGEEGGSEVGVAHAPLALRSAATAAAQNAAGVRPDVADWQEHRASFALAQGEARRELRERAGVGQGERCSRVSVPPPGSPFSSADTGNQGGGRRSCDSPADRR
jgi:hypothetical protein